MMIVQKFWSFKPPQNSIATKIIRVTFSIYFVLALILTTVHMVSEYYRVQDTIVDDMKIIQKTLESGIAKIIWDVDTENLETMLKGIYDSPSVVGVKLETDMLGEMVIGNIIDNDGKYLVYDRKGEPLEKSDTIASLFEYTFPLFFTEDNYVEQVGTMTLYSSSEIVFQHVKLGFIFIVANAFLKTLLLWVILYIVIQRLLSRPLKILTAETSCIDLNTLDNVNINIQTADDKTELKALENSFNVMLQKLQKAKQKLEQLNQELEQRVQHRTLQLETVNNDLLRLNQEKNEFLGIAAHDLKNPLQAVQGFAELIANTITDEQYDVEEVIDFANMIGISADRMFDLITNLLDVNAIEEGKMKVNLKHVDILPVLQRVVDEYSKKAATKNITVHFTPEQDSYSAYVDPNTVHQILDNLISNAVKYSPLDKNIFIQMTLKTDMVRIEIQDEGQGLSQEDQAKLFGKFTRLNAKPTGGEHSTGLGLFIVKKLVNALYGDIWCESELGHGATFILILPTRD